MTIAGQSTIRKSTSEDLLQIQQWLIDEKNRGVEGNFFCNWNLIERGHHEGDLLTFIDNASLEPIAFMLGNPPNIEILQVREEFRGRGIGRALVGLCMGTSRIRNECLLDVQCQPQTSIPFWKNMGFTCVEDENSDTYAYCVLETPLPLPDEGVDASVEFRMYSEERMWAADARVLRAILIQGRKTSDGAIHLSQRALFHERLLRGRGDPVIEVTINGSAHHLGKAKHDTWRDLGIVRCRNGWCIDRLDIAPG